MSRRPPAGNAAFEAMGQSDKSRGIPLFAKRAGRISWPLWARRAYARGYVTQGGPNWRKNGFMQEVKP